MSLLSDILKNNVISRQNASLSAGIIMKHYVLNAVVIFIYQIKIGILKLKPK